MKPFVPTTPTFVPSTSHTVQGAMEHRYPRVGEHRSNRVALVRVPVVVPKDSDDRDRERTHASATTAACSGSPKVVRSPASRRRSARPSSVAKAPRTSSRRPCRRERRPRRRSRIKLAPVSRVGRGGHLGHRLGVRQAARHAQEGGPWHSVRRKSRFSSAAVWRAGARRPRIRP